MNDPVFSLPWPSAMLAAIEVDDRLICEAIP